MSRMTRFEVDGMRFRWVSCTQRADWATSRERHLVRLVTDWVLPSWTTTLCGATGTATAWNYSYAKPICKTCEERLQALRDGKP